MNIALIGASGFVGSAVLREALDRGHQVTAIVRHPEKIRAEDNLKVSRGDVHDSAHLTRLITGHDAVISAFSPGWGDLDIYQEQIKGTQSILASIRAAKITRVLWVGGAGSLEVMPGLLVMDTPGFPPHIRAASLATAEALTALRKESSLDWSFLCPTGKLDAGQRTGKFRLGKDQPLVDENGESRITVEDYAVAFIDELENPEHIRERFTVGY
jgi:hypothetical protein